MLDDIPYLSVITRTRNRQIMLLRLMNNLIKQQYRNFEWVIVNDAGDNELVQDVVNQGLALGLKVKLVYNQSSQGRSFAANIGAQNASGQYILILDDDDYIHHTFFMKVHNFFKQNLRYKGVTCWSAIMLEEISSGTIISHGESGCYTPGIEDLSIINLHASNIPTCGFVMDREIFLKIGGFPVGIDCTEDWACTSRFVVEADIGLIPEILAYISKRVNPEGFYKNTTSDNTGIDQHRLHEVVWKNSRIRSGYKDGNIYGLLPILGQLNLQMRSTAQLVNALHQEIRALQEITIQQVEANIRRDYESSLSWRITSLLRFLGKLARRVKKK